MLIPLIENLHSVPSRREGRGEERRGEGKGKGRAGKPSFYSVTCLAVHRSPETFLSNLGINRLDFIQNSSRSTILVRLIHSAF